MNMAGKKICGEEDMAGSEDTAGKKIWRELVVMMSSLAFARRSDQQRHSDHGLRRHDRNGDIILLSLSVGSWQCTEDKQ